MEEALLSLATYGYLGLFVASFLAATVLPFSSEIVFTTLLYTSNCNVWGLVCVGTLGNTLGALTCYAIGRMGKIEWIEKYLLRTPLPQTAFFIFLGKLSRYLAWMFLTYWIW